MDALNPSMFIAATFINIFLVALAVMIHYEFLSRLSHFPDNKPIKPRLRVLKGVVGALIAHSVEVWVFAAGYYFQLKNPAFGTMTGEFDGSFWDCVYFSYTTFSTLGFGDIEPHGLVRFLTGIESLTGLVLITWSASFLFIKMQKYWHEP